MTPSEIRPCDICAHVRVKGEAPGRVVYYCIVHDQRTQAWETCPRWELRGDRNGPQD